jgi:hypothetical protein
MTKDMPHAGAVGDGRLDNDKDVQGDDVLDMAEYEEEIA